MSWISLHNRSQYSILNSTVSVKEYAARAAQYGMESLALTDFGNMYGAVEFFKSCKSHDIKPIIGCSLLIAPGSCQEKKRIPGLPTGYAVLLLAKNQEGYRNLCQLTSKAFLEGFYYYPRIDKDLLRQHAGGLVCFSGPTNGLVRAAILEENEEKIREEIAFFKELFGEDFYFELQRHRMSDAAIQSEGIHQESWLEQTYEDYIAKQERVNMRYLELSKEHGIPCVATNAVQYLERDDWQAHEILMNVQSGEPCEIWEKDAFGNPKAKIPNPKRKVLPTHEFYFKSPEEMEKLFADLPEAIANTRIVAERCQFEMDFSTRFYPVFTPPHLEGKELDEKSRQEAAANYLKELCEKGIQERYTEERLAEVQKKYPDQKPFDVVRNRLEVELNVIIDKGMCDYLLIVWDFIAWAKSQKIPVGPGRGSGAGSIILYLIGITDIEPLRFNLFFERFINPERVSYPDIDVDICMDRRSEVIDYTVRKYGVEKVAQIITFGTMKAKMVIKDVGRVLSIPLAKVNAIAKLVPEDPTMTLEKALEIDQELLEMSENDDDAKRILELGRKLEGSLRNTGIHAAGLIICGDPLTDHIPVCIAKDSEMAVTQYSMKPVESVGMLKIDFLGLKTLTSIQKAFDALALKTGEEVDWANLPFDNAAAFNLLNQGHTLGVFQLESGGMQDLAKQLHIDKFEEIIAVGALYRPGPMEMIPSFINRKHGREKIEYEHELVKDILDETYGIMVYQEQVMQIAQRLANYSLGEGDVLRRAMGKKDREEMARQREKFKLGALENGIDEASSMAIFDRIEKFASYGFNKSHAAAYGYLSYVTAYLKANHPREWMAALMTCDRHDISKIAKYIRECRSMQIPVLSPDINESGSEFVATDSAIRFAMGGIKGVGLGVVETILKERKKGGHFQSLYDFFQRINVKKVGKKAVEQLIDAGCFDFTGWTRMQLRESVSPMFERASRVQAEKAKGVMDLFAEQEESSDSGFLNPPTSMKELSKHELLAKEKELLGFYLSGHPMDSYREQLEELGCLPFHEIENQKNGEAFPVAFIIESAKIRITSKTHRKFAVLMISDGMESLELPVWPELYDAKSHLILENQLIYGVIQVEREDQELKLQCRFLDDLMRVDEEMIQASQEALERAKKMKKSNKAKKMVAPKKEEKHKLLLRLNIDKMRMSHVLELKTLFQETGGSTPIQMEFCTQEKRVGTLNIQSDWGIKLDSALETRLRQLPFFISLQLQELL